MRKGIILVIFAVAAGLLLNVGSCYAAKLVHARYVVEANDTLDSVTSKFMAKNTYGERGHREFRSGIIELNYDKLVKHDMKLVPGMKLKINYWVK